MVLCLYMLFLIDFNSNFFSVVTSGIFDILLATELAAKKPSESILQMTIKVHMNTAKSHLLYNKHRPESSSPPVNDFVKFSVLC